MVSAAKIYEYFSRAVQKVDFDGISNLFYIPSSPHLANMAASGQPPELLRFALENAKSVLSPDTLVIVDTGTIPILVGMGIAATAASDGEGGVVIPYTLSEQTKKPTVSTLSLALSYCRRVFGLVPSAIGSADWERKSIESYASTMATNPVLARCGARLFAGLPYSKVMVKGAWFWSEKTSVPEKFIPPVDDIFQALFGFSPAGRDQKLVEAETGPVGIPVEVPQVNSVDQSVS